MGSIHSGSRRCRAPWRLLGAAGLLATLVATLAAAPAAPAGAATPGRYVALGDSYTAGPLIPNQSAPRSAASGPTRTTPPRCSGPSRSHSSPT